MKRTLVTSVAALALVAMALPALAHGGDIEVAVELGQEPSGIFQYGIVLVWDDGDPISGANVTINASGSDSTETEIAAEGEPGIYLARMGLEPGEWAVMVDIVHPDSTGSIEFDQLVSEGPLSGSVIVVDTVDPDRVGTQPPDEDTVLDLPEPTPSTTTTTTAGEEATATSTTSSTTTTTLAATPVADVVVHVEAESTLFRDVTMRVLHVAALGVWLVPLGAAVFGVSVRWMVPAALVGLVATLGTGVLLMLWGTPVGFPGLFDWEPFTGDQLGPYLTWFLIKMTAFWSAVAATVTWARRTSRWAMWVVLAAVGGAVLAVTVMTQIHVLSHVG